MKTETMVHILTHGDGVADDFVDKARARMNELGADDGTALAAALAIARPEPDPEPATGKEETGKKA